MSKRTCPLEGCTSVVHARGLCNLHYRRARRTGVLPPRKTRKPEHKLSNVDYVARVADCAKCGPQVPVRVLARSGRPKESALCMKGGEEGRVRRSREPQAVEARRRERLKRKYGLSQEDYAQMYAEQDGRCAICHSELPLLFVDHDHETGTIRGLLCQTCNLALGYFRDDPNLLLRAAEYLSTSGTAQAA